MQKAFTIRELVKKYKDFTLGPLYLDLEPGMVQGLIGHNGAGKTSTLLCMAGITRLNSGSIDVFGNPVSADDASWKFDIGYVSDEPAFYENWTGARNLKFISQFYPFWSDELAQKLADRFELNLNMKAKALSRGNRVKLALVAALAHRPKLYLFDEPTSGLDPVVRAEVMEVLWEVMKDGEHSILYSTHILPDISRLADELVFLKNGKVLMRTLKEDLTDNWRRIDVRTDADLASIPGVVNVTNDGNHKQVITADFRSTMEALKQRSISTLGDSRLNIEEIAVHIMRGK